MTCTKKQELNFWMWNLKPWNMSDINVDTTFFICIWWQAQRDIQYRHSVLNLKSNKQEKKLFHEFKLHNKDYINDKYFVVLKWQAQREQDH